MRILVMSDTHGNIRAAERAMAAVPDAEMIVHAGDYYSDAARLRTTARVSIVAVKGNCDRFSPGAMEETIEVSGNRLILLHGHTRGVKYDLSAVKQWARKAGATIVVYGHTHIPNIETDDECLFVNPGSLQSPRTSANPTYATIEIVDGNPTAEIHELRPV